MNSASFNNNYITSPVLVRAVIDHIPRIFRFNNFSEVANNYSGGTKSFKKSMKTLLNVKLNYCSQVYLTMKKSANADKQTL